MNLDVVDMVHLTNHPYGLFFAVDYGDCLLNSAGQPVTPSGIIQHEVEKPTVLRIIKETTITVSCNKSDLEQNIVSILERRAIKSYPKCGQLLLDVGRTRVEISRRSKRGVANTMICSQQFYQKYYDTLKQIILRWITVNTNHVFVGCVDGTAINKPFSVVEHETTYDVFVHPHLQQYWVNLQL